MVLLVLIIGWAMYELIMGIHEYNDLKKGEDKLRRDKEKLRIEKDRFDKMHN